MLPDQSAIPCFTITNSQQDDYFWQPNFSDHMILNQKRQSTSDDLSEKKLLQDITLKALPRKSEILCLIMGYFKLVDYLRQQNFSNHMKLRQKTSSYITRSLRKTKLKLLQENFFSLGFQASYNGLYSVGLLPQQPNVSNHIQWKLETCNYSYISFRVTEFKVVVGGHFFSRYPVTPTFIHSFSIHSFSQLITIGTKISQIKPI